MTALNRTGRAVAIYSDAAQLQLVKTRERLTLPTAWAADAPGHLPGKVYLLFSMMNFSQPLPPPPCPLFYSLPLLLKPASFPQDLLYFDVCVTRCT